MNSVWYMLLWKEWREHRLIIAMLAAAAIPIPLFRALRRPEDFFLSVTVTLFAVPMIAMFLAMHVAAREQSKGTIRFLQALPVARAKPAAAKLFWAIVTITVPIALVVGVVWGWAQMHDPDVMRQAAAGDLHVFGSFWRSDNWYAARFLAPTIGGVSLLLWMAAAGVNRSDEVRAGAIGFLVILCVWGMLAIGAYQLQQSNGHAALPRWFGLLMSAAPGGLGVATAEAAFVPATGPTPAHYIYWPFALAAAVSHAALAAWFMYRFGRVLPGRRQAIESPARSEPRAWLAPPRRSPLSAIVWKQVRESAPLALLGAAGIMAVTLLIVWIAHMDARHRPMEPQDIVGLTYAVWMMVGFGVATVAGVGALMDDLNPGIHSFWRSRPINVDMWFGVKFFCGLFVTIASLSLGALVIVGSSVALHGLAAVAPGPNMHDELAMLGVGLLLQTGLFSAAVAAMALLRHAVYAAVAAIAGLGATMVAGEQLIQSLGVVGRDAEALMLAVSVVALIGAIVLAWLAVRNDWGWKR